MCVLTEVRALVVLTLKVNEVAASGSSNSLIGTTQADGEESRVCTGT